jgi:hypothetical protein
MSPILSRVPLPLLGEAIGFDTTNYKDLLAHHEHRLKLQRGIARIIYWLIGLTLFPLAALLAAPFIFSGHTVSFASSSLGVVVFTLLIFTAAGITMRFSDYVTLRFFFRLYEYSSINVHYH